MYPYPKHQTELFRFDDSLESNIQDDSLAESFFRWKFDYTLSSDKTLEFAVLGTYKIFMQNDDRIEIKRLYTLNAGRVFEIGLFDLKDETTDKLLKDCFQIVWSDLERIFRTSVKNSALKRFDFPPLDNQAYLPSLYTFLSGPGLK